MNDLFTQDTTEQVIALAKRGALFVINHSGGKDSQAMTAYVRSMVPDSQLVVMHAHLADVEWEGSQEHIEATIGEIPLIIAEPKSTFFDIVERRQMFPSPQQRQCTSDLKRGPCEREIRRYLKEHPEYNGLIVNCMGMRAEESTGRSKLVAFKRNEGNSIEPRTFKNGRSTQGREWYDWLPIHDWSTEHVFDAIEGAGQKPFWTYAAGMTRKSCCFCIMASKDDLTCAAKLRPALYKRYVETEKRLGFTLQMSGKTLPEITGINP